MRLVVGLLVVGPACRVAPTERPRGEPTVDVPAPAAPETGYAVLPWGTQVYVEPRVGALSARLGWPSLEPPPWPSRGYVVQVLGERDGFVTIAPLHAAGMHCESVLEGDVFDVRLYVSRWAPATVVTRDVRIDYDDGTSVTLHPGAPAQPIPGDLQGRWAVAVNQMGARVILPDDAVGRSYDESTAISPSGGGWQLSPDAVFSVDGGSPLEVQWRFGSAQAVISRVEPHGDDHLVELQTPCMQATVLAPRAPASERHWGTIDFGLGGPDTRLAIGEAALDPMALLGLEPAAPVLEDFPAEDVPVEAELRMIEEPEFDGVILGELPFEDVDLGARFDGFGEGWVFEQDAPVYLGGAVGPASGRLTAMRHFTEQAFTAGDRVCFYASFGVYLTPALPVCLDAVEGHVPHMPPRLDDFGSGRVVPGPVVVRGAIDEVAVARTLRTHRHELRRCYNEALRSDFSLTGKMTLEVELRGDGTVSSSRPRSTWAASVVECATEAAKTWRWPETDDGEPATVTFELELTTR